MQNKYPFSVFIALFSILFLVIFSFTVTLLGSFYIVSDLGGSNFTGIYAVAFFSIGNAIGIPLGKPLAERRGIVKSLVSSLLFFALISFLCGKASNFPIFVTCRFFQGFAAGPFYYLIFALLGDIAPKEKKSVFNSVMVTLFAVVPVLGGSWGGSIAYELNWRLSFFSEVPFFLFLAIFIGIRLKDYRSEIKKTPFDGIGYVFYSIGILSLGSVLTTGQELDWFRSSLITTLSIVAILSLVFFVLWEINHPHRIIEMHLFKKPIFCFALFNLAVLFSAYFGMIVLLGHWLNLYVNYTPIWIGALIGGMAVAGILPTILIIKFGKTDARIPLILAIIFLAVSSFHTMTFSVDINFGRIAFSRVVAGFGLALFLPPLFRLCFNNFPEDQRGNVVAPLQIVRALASGLGGALYTILWHHRQVFFRERLGSKLTVFSEETTEFFSNAKELHLEGLVADAQLDDFLERQATALALDDCFYLMAWTLMGLGILILLTLFFRRDVFSPEKYPSALTPDTNI